MPIGFTLCPILGTWEQAPRPNKVVFTPEIGDQKTRRRGTARTIETSLQKSFTRSERSDFWDWYFDDLIDGTLVFIAEHPYEQTAYDWRFAEEPREVWRAPRSYVQEWRLIRLPS